MNNERLDNISNSLGISKRKRTLFELEQISDNEMKLIIKNGKLNLSVPWFGMSGNTPCTLVPAGLFEAIINTLKNAQKENFELKLEKSIWQHIPVDFGDVWSVAIDEIKKSKFKKEPNLDRVVKKIKKEHPNLFVDMQSLIQSKEN